MIKQAIGRIKTASKAITRSELNCLDLLRSDHMKVEAMLLQLRISHDEATRNRLFRSIRGDLLKHMRIEEEIFYPACEQVNGLTGIITDCYHEHEEIRQMFNRLKEMQPTSKRYSEMVTDIIKHFEHHVMEEEDEVFPDVQEKMSEKDFVRMNRMVIQAHHGNGSVVSIARASRKSTRTSATRGSVSNVRSMPVRSRRAAGSRHKKAA